MTRDVTPSLVRGYIAVDRFNFDIAARHIAGHDSYLKHLELLGGHHRSVNLLDTPMNIVLDVLLDLPFGRVAKAQSLERIVQLNETFGDEIGSVLAIQATLGVRVDKLAVATNEMGR